MEKIMKLYLNEVKDMKELREILKDNKDISQEYQVAVIAYVLDDENRIIFQRRGPGCRDERFKLETIGGRVKESDVNFREALKREVTEEAGPEANIELGEFITSTYVKTFNERYNKEEAWVYLVYKGSLKDGELKITEPHKNLGYERYKIGEVDENELSNGAIELYEIVQEKYRDLK